MLENVSEVTVVTKMFFFFLKILHFVQSFVECKVSLADGRWSCGTPIGIPEFLNIEENKTPDQDFTC
jgi:hypothetical protein